MPLTTNTKNTILKSLVGKNQGMASAVYLGLSSTTPTVDGENITEPVANRGYARVLVGSYSSSYTQLFGNPTNGSITNDATIYFPEATDSWGDPLTHFVLFSSATDTSPSSVLGYGELRNENGDVSPISVLTAKTVVMFRVGTLSISYSE